MRCHDETVTVREREVRLWRGGQGRPLLFLHDPWTYRWLPLHDRLAERYQVVMPVHPGFDGTQGLEEVECVEDLVFHYVDLCEALRLEQPILIGASLGGWIAAEFAIRYSGMLRALVLIDALGLRVPGAAAADLFRLDPAQLRAAIFADPAAALASEVIPDIPPQDTIEAMLKARQAFARVAWQFPDNPKLARYLYRVKCPTFIIWGAQDGVVPVAHAQRYQAEIVAAEHTVLSSCGHLPHLEQSEILAAKVLEYLRRQGGGA
jgi:pimeloyl-ACP methyl ester carboxylesterase